MTLLEAKKVLKNFQLTEDMDQEKEYSALLSDLLPLLETYSQQEKLVKHFEKEYYSVSE